MASFCRFVRSAKPAPGHSTGLLLATALLCLCTFTWGQQQNATTSVYTHSCALELIGDVTGKVNTTAPHKFSRDCSPVSVQYQLIHGYLLQWSPSL